MSKGIVPFLLTRKVRDTMSRSNNVRSKYQIVPRHVQVSISVRDSGNNKRSRDERGKAKNNVRATVNSILVEYSKEV
jgi:hypothetical protein